MREYNRGKSKAQIRQEQDIIHDSEEKAVSLRARKWFRAKPYETHDVLGYIAKKYEIRKKGVNGGDME